MKKKKLETAGRTLDYAASIYDQVINLTTFGQAVKIRQKEIQTIPYKPTDQILDIGCGTGSMTLQLAATLAPKGHITGIDAAGAMIDVAQKNLNRQNLDQYCSFVYALAEKLPFPDNSFDCCFSSMFFHHVPQNLKIAALYEAYRVLKPGGIFVVIDIDKAENIFTRMFGFISYCLLVQPALKENFQGIMPGLIKNAGFANLKMTDKKWGLVASYHAIKPEEEK